MVQIWPCRLAGRLENRGEFLSNRDEIRIGGVLFNTATGNLRGADGARIELRGKATDVLACLAAHRGEIVDNRTIMDAVWHDVTVTDEGLTQCITDIRNAIRDSDQTLLTTHVGKGYSLTVQQDKRGGHIWPVIGVAMFILIAFSGVAMLWMAGALSKPD